MESQQTSQEIAEDFLSESVDNSTDVELPGSEESNISSNLKQNINIIRATNIKSIKNVLQNIYPKNLNKLIFSHLNINSVWKEFDSLVNIVNKNIDVFLISDYDCEDISCDVESLCTKILFKETIEYILHNIYFDKLIKPFCKMSIFKQLLA